MEEENNWNVSNQNKKSGNRFTKQLIIFLIFIIILGIIAYAVMYVYTGKTNTVSENENSKALENNIDDENAVNNEEIAEKVSANLDDEVYSITSENKHFYFDDEEESKNSTEDDENDEDTEDVGIELYEYDNSKDDYAELYYQIFSYNTDSKYSYVVKVEDETGESVLVNDRANAISEDTITPGGIESIKINKDTGSTLNITIREMYEHSAKSRTVEREAKVTLNLNEDLEKQEKIDVSSSKSSYELGDMKFETYKEDKASKTTSTTYSTNCKIVTYEIDLSVQYGNEIISDGIIEFKSLTNINELSLDDAFSIESEIEEKIGDYGLSDKYEIEVSNGSGDVTTKYEITFEQMQDLLDGKEANTSKKKIKLEDIAVSEDDTKTVSESTKVKIGNGINAIKYTYKGDSNATYYMFIVNENIYYISVPNGDRYEDNVNIFLDSLAEKE